MAKSKTFTERISSVFKGAKKESSNVFNYMGWKNGTTTSKFVRDIISNKERKTHEEKLECKKAYRDNALIYSAIRTFKDIIKGDRSRIDTRNDILKKYIEDKFLNTTGFLDAEDVAIEEAITTGDGYIEEVKGETLIEYRPIYNTEDMYIDYDYETDEVKRYIMRVYGVNMKKEGVGTHTIYTPYGIETVIGYELSKESIIHYKFGNDVYGVYGRSPIAPTLNDVDILKKIERAVAIIAMYKAVPKKILMPDSADEEDSFSPGEITQIEDLLRNSTDFENPIIDKRIAELDLSNGGKDVNMQPYIDYLKRKITVAMAPEFLIHGEEVNRATSREQKQTYYLRVAATRRPFEITTTKALREGVNHMLADNKFKKDLIGVFTYEYGDFDIELPQERQERLLQNWNDGAMTLKELRAELDLQEIEGTDVFKWEVTSNDPTMLPAENETKRKSKDTKSEKTN